MVIPQTVLRAEPNTIWYYDNFTDIIKSRNPANFLSVKKCTLVRIVFKGVGLWLSVICVICYVQTEGSGDYM